MSCCGGLTVDASYICALIGGQTQFPLTPGTVVLAQTAAGACVVSPLVAPGNMFLIATSTAPSSVKATANAVLTGVNDDVIINTYTALGSVRISDGDVIPSNTIHAIQLPGATFECAGMGETYLTTRGAGTLIRPSASFPANTPVIDCQQPSNNGPVGRCTLRGFELNMVNVVNSGITGILMRSYQFRMENIFVQGSSTSNSGIVIKGFTAGDPSGAWNTYDGIITGVQSRGCGNHGIELSTATSDLYMSNCTFLNNTNAGIYRGGGSSIQCNNVQSYFNGIGLQYDAGGSRDRWIGCKIEHNSKQGVWFNGASAGTSGVTLDGCVFNCNGQGTNNTYSHIECIGTFQTVKLTIANCQFGNSDGVANLAKYAIDLGVVGVGVIVAACQFGSYGTYSTPSAAVTSILASAGVATGIINVGNSTVKQALTVIGCQGLHDLHGSPLPTGAAGSGAGTSPPAPVVNASSRDWSGLVTYGTGTTPVAFSALVVITFAIPMDWTQYSVALTPQNTAAGSIGLIPTALSSTSFGWFHSTTPAGSLANTNFSVGWGIIA